MADVRLSEFVRESLLSGASKTDIEKVLKETGWSKDQITSALGEFSAVDFPIPVPHPKAHLLARDAFLYLVMFSMLYLVAYNLGALLFHFVTLTFPDPSIGKWHTDWIGKRIRFSTSALLVSFPVFLYVSSVIAKQTRKDPFHRTSKARKWLTYLTLAIAACIIVGDLIYLLYSLLSGELTVRFILKVLIVGIISSSIFAYYLWMMHKDDEVLTK